MVTLNKKELAKRLLNPFTYFVSFLDYFWPKKDNLIIFGSELGQYASGSPKALFEYFKDSKNDYDILFYTPFDKSRSFFGKISYILKFSPFFFKAKFLVSSHPPYDFFPFVYWSDKKVLVNTWHGTGLKAIFFADVNEKEDNLKRITRLNNKTSIFLVSSDLDASIMIKCFQINSDKLYLTGQPRNDFLLSEKNERKLNRLCHVPYNSKVILYCPTYRRNSRTKFFPFEDFDLEDLNNFLVKNNLFILIRGHVYNELDKANTLFTDRIIDFSFEVCNDVNVILNEIDILITDYSSIYTDYLILNRPCIFIPYDLDDYIKNRGLLMDYEHWTPGDKIKTYPELIKSLNKIVNGEDTYEKRRVEICKQFHENYKINSSEEVFKVINTIKNNN